MKVKKSLRTAASALWVGRRLLSSPLGEGIVPKMPLREFEGACLLMASYEQKLVRQKGGQLPSGDLDQRYRACMSRYRDYDREQMQQELRRVGLEMEEGE